MHRRPLLALLAPLVAVGACAHPAADVVQEVETGSVEAIHAARTTSAEAATGRVEMTVEVATGRGDPIVISSNGAFDRPAERFAMEVELAGLGGRLRLVIDGDTAYLGLPSFGDGDDPTWVAVEADALGAATGAIVDRTSQDPTTLLELLRGIDGDIVEQGTEELRGVATTRYSGVVDLQAVAEAVPPADRDSVAIQLDDLFGGLEQVPIDLWIDHDGLVHRLQVALSEPEVKATIVLDVFDYGRPVAIEVPEAADVRAVGDLLERWLGAFGGAGS